MRTTPTTYEPKSATLLTDISLLNSSLIIGHHGQYQKRIDAGGPH
jgi:hypothetical protein